tara:strand:+ start:818 stop:1555 length:738 start_codon:yes stop_codon:yes gene_type:complete
MKKLFIYIFSLSFFCSFSQEEIYVGLHYFKVKTEHAAEFVEAEKNYFSKIHKARIDAGEKIGWDMWRAVDPEMTNSEHTTFIFAHLQGLDQTLRVGNPNNMFPQSEMSLVRKDRGKMVLSTHFVQTVLKGGFAPVDGKPSQIVVLNFHDIKAGKDYDYEQFINSRVPSMQGNELLKGYGLHKIVSPINDGSDYISARFFDSQQDLHKNNVNTTKPSKDRLNRIKKWNSMASRVKTQMFQLVLSER